MASVEILLAVGEVLGLVAAVVALVFMAGWAAGLLAGGLSMTLLCMAGSRQVRAIRASRQGQRHA